MTLAQVAPAAHKHFEQSLPPMGELLAMAGFRVRGRRADCVHCDGHSRLTVAFTSDVAFCHRCSWRANTITLVRQLRLLRNDPAAVARLREERLERERREVPLREFELWRDRQISRFSDEYRILSQKATLAHRVFQFDPEEPHAWDALSRFYHAEARLLRTLDWLMFAKASAYLECDSTPEFVYRTWRICVAPN